mmetsp:Transcript_17522/g.30066  ORF Transcript_17522/g.30066 Transcript_17522/m.30066 type:complete len:137 (-) Transcript_17522:725-1135(-)
MAPAPEQIIARNVPLPPPPTTFYSAWPAESAVELRGIMPDDMWRLFFFNKGPTERICPSCMTHYRVVPETQAVTRQLKEQLQSGLCCEACFVKLAGDVYDPSEWMGERATGQLLIQPDGRGGVAMWAHGPPQGANQ